MLKDGNQAIVIRNKDRQFRVDPNPAHHHEEWANAWTDDLSKAHPFAQKEARKFLAGRTKDYRTEHEARDLTFVTVDIIDGVPTMPQEKGGVLSWLRST